MKKISYLLIITIMNAIGWYSCSKPDNDYSILEPAFERKYLKSVTLNGVKWIDVHYQEPGKISAINYYNNQGQLLERRTERVTYEGNKISTQENADYKWTFLYNSNGDIDKIEECPIASGQCCIYNYTYDYQVNNLPQKINMNCGSGYMEETIYDYKNLANRSYISFTTNNNNQNSRKIVQKTKFIDGTINPLYTINPFIFDYYLDNIEQNFTEKYIIETSVEQKDGLFPTRIVKSLLDPNTLEEQASDTYLFEYN